MDIDLATEFENEYVLQLQSSVPGSWMDVSMPKAWHVGNLGRLLDIVADKRVQYPANKYRVIRRAPNGTEEAIY